MSPFAPLPAPGTSFPVEAWEHLLSFGYAPGNYAVRCHRCNQVHVDADKRATTCRTCAQALHEEKRAPAQPVPGA